MSAGGIDHATQATSVPRLLPESLSALPTDELYLLIDQVFAELDSPAPRRESVMQYNDLISELDLRMALNLPDIRLDGEGK